MIFMGCASSKATEEPQIQNAPQPPRPGPSREGQRSRPPSRAQGERRPSSSAKTRPPGSSHGHPGGNSRPSSQHRPRSSRPSSASGTRRPSSSGKERPTSSYPRRFDAIPEHAQYTEDSAIVDAVKKLNVHIDQHAATYYVLDDSIGSHKANSLASIRRRVARTIIDNTVMVEGGRCVCDTSQFIYPAIQPSICLSLNRRIKDRQGADR